ncbi:MAG: hypothetical protein BA872_09705 [Desulfobacterales bacterium C00003060]|nr:MAG: hypothetical protein BA872_09705 [Desulfobacterales bacterium C00003060]
MSIECTLQSILKASSSVLAPLKLKETEKKVNDLLKRLKDKFVILVLGEFSSGKSTFINAFLKENILSTSILPETAAITVVAYGREKKARIVYKDLRKHEINDETELNLIKRDAAGIDRVEFFYPLPQLNSFLLVDTPGLNSVFTEHEETTKEFLHKADMVIWIFDALKVGKLREKEYLEYTKEYPGEMIGVVNKIDLVDQKDLAVLHQFLESHFQGLFSKIFFMSSVGGDGFDYNAEEDRNYHGNVGFKDFEDFLFQEIIPARKMFKCKGTLSSLSRILGETCISLDKGERDLIDKKSTLKEVTGRLREIKGYLTDRLCDIISDAMRIFANNSKKSCRSLLKEEVNIVKALWHISKPPDIVKDFNKHVLGEKLVKNFFNSIARNMEGVLIKGWKGRINQEDIQSSVQIPTSCPRLGSELDGMVNELFFRVAEKMLPLVLICIVATFILLAIRTVTFAAFIPTFIIILGVILGQWYLVKKQRGLVNHFSQAIDEYFEAMTERIKVVAANLNERLFFKAQEKVISDMLGYNISCGEVEDRLVSIRRARDELKNLLGEASMLEREISLLDKHTQKSG